MYIKVEALGEGSLYVYTLYAANHRDMLGSRTAETKAATIRAAKKMAKQLNIEYREN